MLLPLSIIFSEEKEEKNDELIIGSVSRSRWINNKIISSILFTSLLSLLFYVVDFISFYSQWPVDQITNPLYSIDVYQNTFYRGSILSFFVLEYFLRLLAFLTMAFIFMFTSLKTRKTTLSLSINFLLLIMVSLSTDVFEVIFNPFNFLTNKDLFKSTSSIALGGMYIEKVWWMILASVLFLIFLFIIFRNEAKNERN